MKNLAPAGGVTEGAAGWLYDGTAPDALDLLNVSTYLDRTPIRPRAENWFWLGGIGGIPKPCSEEFEDFRSVTPLGAWLPLMGPFNLWSGIPFWKDSFVGGGGRGGSSAGTAAPSSTHRFNFSS